MLNIRILLQLSFIVLLNSPFWLFSLFYISGSMLFNTGDMGGIRKKREEGLKISGSDLA